MTPSKSSTSAFIVPCRDTRRASCAPQAPEMTDAGSRPDLEDRRAADAVVLQVGQGIVRSRKGVGRGLGDDWNLARQREQRACVLPGVCCDAAERTLLEQVALIIERGDLREVDPCHGEGRAAVELLERCRDELPCGREQDCSVEPVRWGLEAAPHPGRAQLLGEGAMVVFATEHVHLAARVPCEL